MWAGQWLSSRRIEGRFIGWTRSEQFILMPRDLLPNANEKRHLARFPGRSAMVATDYR